MLIDEVQYLILPVDIHSNVNVLENDWKHTHQTLTRPLKSMKGMRMSVIVWVGGSSSIYINIHLSASKYMRVLTKKSKYLTKYFQKHDRNLTLFFVILTSFVIHFLDLNIA